MKGGKAAIEKINSSIEKGINFTQETTLSGAKTIRTIKQAREHNYYIRLYYIGVNSAQESIKRISKDTLIKSVAYQIQPHEYARLNGANLI